MNDSIFAFAIVAGLWGMAAREYLAGRRRDWLFFAVGTVAGLTAVVLATWDVRADLGRRGDLAIVFALVILGVWSVSVGWKYIRPGA
jgi:hypothetical protein